MKRLMCIVLALVMMLLCGCESAQVDPDGTGSSAESSTGTPLDVTEITDPDGTLPHSEVETQGGEAQTSAGTGCVRVSYNGNVSTVRYITSVDELPDNEALAAYDEAYFETGALVLVMESTASGSVQVGIESVENGVVTLSHEMTGDAGTADMATWLLWAEVEAGLDWEWSIANPALPSNTSAY